MFKHGDRVTAYIWDHFVEDARLSQSGDGQWFICFNDGGGINPGDSAPDKLGYKYSRSILDVFSPGCELYPTGGRKTRDIKLLSELNTLEEENMNTADKLFNSKLSEDEKTLREAGFKNKEGRVTTEGTVAMMDYLYSKHGKDLAAAVRELKDCECKDKEK